MAKVYIMYIVKRLKPRFNSYVIDEIAKKVNKTILRLPPYNCELNPIELVWSMVKGYVKANNSTFKPEDVKHLLHTGLDRVKSEDWKSHIDHAKKEEENFWNLDFIFDEHLTRSYTDN
ncbi:Hypothetical protein CINCED_3A004287 [Cinara cedri]|uniref:Tc1-like transposase DDE domain-containing protein n=1 Tax=Cinara cedri TaxID=506608 RepID=A0A5E4MFA1_9HEMI|nr:Hypothetical protein CINCED_3A004287 [Cinara cedri]